MLVDPQAGVSFDFWQATLGFDDSGIPIGGGVIGSKIIEAGGLGRFELNGSGAQVAPQGRRGRSARATGLPLLGGLLLPEDLAAGKNSVIEHALAFAMPRARYQVPPPEGFANFVYPASNLEEFNALPTRYLLCGGQRLVLNDDVFDSNGRAIRWQEDGTVPPIISIVLRAFRDYGVCLVDGSKGFTLYAEDYHTAHWQLNPLDAEPHISDAAMESLVELMFLPGEKPPSFPANLPPNWPTVASGLTATPWHLLMLGLDDLLTWRIGHYNPEEANARIPFAVTVNGELHFNFRMAQDLPTPTVP